jgi:hypothetical protein
MRKPTTSSQNVRERVAANSVSTASFAAPDRSGSTTSAAVPP